MECFHDLSDCFHSICPDTHWWKSSYPLRMIAEREFCHLTSKCILLRLLWACMYELLLYDLNQLTKIEPWLCKKPALDSSTSCKPHSNLPSCPIKHPLSEVPSNSVRCQNTWPQTVLLCQLSPFWKRELKWKYSTGWRWCQMARSSKF